MVLLQDSLTLSLLLMKAIMSKASPDNHVDGKLQSVMARIRRGYEGDDTLQYDRSQVVLEFKFLFTCPELY